MLLPKVIVNDSFQIAWIDAIKHLDSQGWDTWNLNVYINDPTLFDDRLDKIITNFTKENNILLPKHVAYTIFPYKQYKGKGTANELYKKYIDRFYPWAIRRANNRWGTYFYRMIHYEQNNNIQNQLDNIIKAINNRTNLLRASYTIQIPYPGSETIRPRGGPCLNYLAIQILPKPINKLGLLAIYRNHEFFERAYGNYLGLCNLIKFISEETGFLPGPLTCISSHAYIPYRKSSLRKLIKSLQYEIS